MYIAFMRILSLILLSLLATAAFAQPNVRMYYEQSSEGFILYADNPEHCPVSVKLKLELTNYRAAGGPNQVVVLPARSIRTNVGSLNVADKSKASNFRYTYTTNFGDHNLDKYTADFNYYLPYKKDTSHKVWQGYNGKFSHQGENALDFVMPEGTDILAVRDGLVVKVVQENDITCKNRDCAKFNNYILIYHPDGTFAEYAHIRRNGAIVKVGEKVQVGQSIGYSGNVGFSSGPHLHLAIFMQKLDKRITLTTRFLTGDGTQAEALQEHTAYLRSY